MVGAHAVVLGASMAGLLAARVLAELYGAVTVVERDELPEAAANRRGVPQGRHAHGLLGRGSLILDDLFQGFEDELVAAGVPAFDYRDLSKAYFSLAGHRASDTGSFKDIPPLYFPSRPLLESLVRRRVRETPNVEFLLGHDAADLTTTSSRDRITGVRVASHNGAAEHALDADLVVDATGRGGRTPAALDDLGYGRPAEEKVAVNVAYSSQLLRISPGTLREMVVATTPVPGRPTGMALFGYENDTWMFTVFGMAGREPPRRAGRAAGIRRGDHAAACDGRAAERRADHRDLPVPLPGESVAALRQDEAVSRRVAGDRRRGGQLQPDLRAGHDSGRAAGCCLRRCLSRGESDLARRYFRAAAKPIGVAWRFAISDDLSLPEVEGRRSLSARLGNSYVERLLTVCESDNDVAEQLIRVTGLIDPPTRLFRPKVMYRAARARPPR